MERERMERARRGAGGPADKEIDPLLRRTTHRRAGTAPQGDCLDAETLAAWTDGSLTAVQRSAAETHAADCDRCLSVLAAIARTNPPPSATQRPAWLSFRWLVPLTTAAIAITAWVLIQEPPRPSPPPAATAAAPAAKPAEPSVVRERDVNEQARADAPQEKVGRAAPSRSKDKGQSRRPALSADAKQRAESGAVAEQVQVQAQAPPAPAAPPPPAAAPRPAAKEERVDFLARAAAKVAGAVVQSPDSAIRWRLIRQQVERSTDGGLTWKAQPTGTAVDLLAASSPAPSVCWIVGRTGVVLLSTDGESWRRLSSPDVTADLVAVTARDAVAATVTTADGRRYTTFDAGGTWTPTKDP